MSHPKKVSPVLYFIAVTEREKGSFEKIKATISEELGLILFQSPYFEFSQFTDYYTEEMGHPLWKSIYFFEILKEPEFLIDLKYLCYSIERKEAFLEKRSINLDPGYLTLSKVVLSTFKDYAHRLYLGRSVFAEVTLIYRKGSFESLPWTYPDYKEPFIIESFNKARALYKKKVNAYR